MTFKCPLCNFETEVESESIEHKIKKHAASSDELFGTGA